MSHVAHEIYEEFPEEAKKIEALKQVDPHFSKLVDDYHEVNRQVYRADARLDVMAEDAEHELRHQRLQLKDEIFRLLHAAA